MHILVATSEAVPFAKTGGLADVCGTLPVEIAGLGHRSTLIMPAYRQVRESGVALEKTGAQLSVPMGTRTVTGSPAPWPAARERGAGLLHCPGRVLRSRRDSTALAETTSLTIANGSSSSVGRSWNRSGCWIFAST